MTHICSMSARVSLGVPHKAAVRGSQRRKMGLDVDLNAIPFEILNDVGSSSETPLTLEVPLGEGPRRDPVAIDVDSIDDDDVILSSPRAFAEVIVF